jgi:sugar lactone lactonase YvrE
VRNKRLSPDGAVIGRIDVPAANVTSCTFAGDALDQLFITSAYAGVAE